MRNEIEKLHSDLLSYGNFIDDENLVDNKGNFIRIRIICYKNKFFKDKMVNGKIEEVKEIK